MRFVLALCLLCSLSFGSTTAHNAPKAGDGAVVQAAKANIDTVLSGSTVAASTPSSTLGDHTTNGTTCSIKTTAAHNLVAGKAVTISGWTWSDGGGVVNGTWKVTAITDTTTFTITPTTCPTTGTNPSVVGGAGTIVPVTKVQLGNATANASTTAPVEINGSYAVDGVVSWAASVKPTTLPSGAALTVGARWYDTAEYRWFFWNGTYWLTEQLFVLSGYKDFGGATSSGALTIPCVFDGAHDVYVEKIEGSLHVDTTNDGTNYWSLSVHKFLGDSSDAAVGSAVTTAANTASRYVQTSGSVAAFVDCSAAYPNQVVALQLVYTKVESPGALYGQGSVTYRLAHR